MTEQRNLTHILKEVKRIFDPKRYFYYQKNYMFEKYNSEKHPVHHFDESNKRIFVIKTLQELEDLTAQGFSFSECPFVKIASRGLGKGAILFAAFKGKRFIHASLVSVDGYKPPSDPILQRMKDKNAGFIGPCYTVPEERGKGVYPEILSRVYKFLHDENKSRAIIYTKKTNTSSIRGIEKAGFKFVREFKFIKLLFWGRLFNK